MAEISGVSSSTNIYSQLSSGKRINSAADDPSGLVISNTMQEQENGLNVGSENAQAGIDMLNVAEGGLAQINDSLQRIYELSVKASNGLNTGEELGAIQSEVNQLLDQIQGVAKGTEYNTMSLLDGSMADMELATNPNGTGSKIQMYNSTLEALGIDGYDVTGKFDINRITDAIAKVSEGRSRMGAEVNALESGIRYNDYAAENTMAARSSLEDLDMAKAISEQKKQETLNQYQTMMQKKKQEDEQNKMMGILNGGVI